MSTGSSPEFNGNLRDFPAAELLREAITSKFNGTFRFSQGQQKIAVYLADGEIVFAASNLRQHRFLIKLIQWNFVQEKDAAPYQNVPDTELGAKLVEAGKLTPLSLEMCQLRQVAEIISAALVWHEGEWHYNPLVRIKENLRVAVDTANLLVEAARNFSPQFVASRFQHELDSLAPADVAFQTFNLSPEEAYVYSRVDGVMSVDALAAMSGLPEEKVKPIVYNLWLGGLLRRLNYPAAFDEATTVRIIATKAAPAAVTGRLSPPPAVSVAAQIKTEVKVTKVETKPAVTTAPAITISAAPVETVLSAEEQLKQVEEFLDRVTAAKTHYQVLDLPHSTPTAEVKQTYFRLAKQFHPDKFHSLAGNETHNRLHAAFNKLSQAYETLKDSKLRELYDFKLKKEGAVEKADVSTLSPAEVFKQGMEALQNGSYNEGLALLTRAINLAPNVAEYHARFGQALSVNSKFRHQAESELQTAVRLDERSPEWRMALAEFYLEMKLTKRAEGELKKLLGFHPNHVAARQKLNSLR